MKLKAIYLFLLGVLRLSLQNNNPDVIGLVKDFLIKLDFPFKITAYVCWSKDIQLLLWKQMSAQNLSCQMGKFNENIPSYFSPEHLLFLLDANCNGSNILLQQASQLKLFSHPYKWIVLDQADQKTFKGIFLAVDSRVFIIKKIVESDIYRIVSWYEIEENSSEILENDVAEWHPKRGFLLYNKLNSANRSNMMGLNVNVTYTALFSDSYNHLDDFRDTQLDPVLKTSWILTNCAMEMINMTSTKIIRSSYGKILPNTTRYDGLVGDIQSGVAEIAGNSFYLRSDRIPFVEYVAPCCPSYLRFIFRAPPLSFVSNIFILPFDLNVWYSCLGLIPVILIAVYLIAVWESKDPIFKEKSSSPKLEPGIFNALLMELGAITQQGAEAEPKSNSGRIATIITFICLMFLFTAYSANIVALLQSTAENIKNPEDLLNYSIALGMRDIYLTHYYYKTSTEPIVKAVYNKMSPKGQKPNFMTLEEGVDRMQKEFFAFQTDPTSAYKIIEKTYQENEKCQLREITVFNAIEPYVAIKKRSPYKEVIKIGMKKIMESGIQRRTIDRIYSKKPKCHGQGSSFGSAAILDCYAAYVIFGVGVGISFIIFCFEIIFNKKKLNTCLIFGKMSQK